MSNVVALRDGVNIAPHVSEEGYEDLPAVMSPRVLAEVLEVSASTLARWRDAKQGPAWHTPPGTRMIRYSRVDFVSWLRESRVGTAS